MCTIYKTLYISQKERDHTNPVNIVWLGEVAVNPVQNVQGPVCTASRQAKLSRQAVSHNSF